MHEPVIVSAVRTPVGKHGGVLSSVRPDDLGALVMKAAVDRSGIDASDLCDVYFGCANGAGEDNRNVARMGALLAGLPLEVPAATVNRLCGSGLEAVSLAAKSVRAGSGEAFLCGGVESMSRAPFVMPKPERAFATGNTQMFDTTLGWRFINPKMHEMYGTDAMGETAENLAEQYGIARETQDRFALESHRKAAQASQSGSFNGEILAVDVKTKKGTVQVTQDEGIRFDASLESLGQLKPVFRKGGTVTAGNSSSFNDGASALVVTSKAYAQAHNLEVLATIKGCTTAGVPPRIMGIGPVPATRKLLSQFGYTLNDLSSIEINEAFAAQTLAVLQELGLSPEDERINPQGGAIALGHALGSSGSRILTTLVHRLRRTGGGLGLAALCIGVGQGIAMVVEVA